MNRFRNRIYYSICQKTYELFKNSGYQTFRNYSKSVKNDILTASLSNNTTHLVTTIIIYLKKIYALTDEESLSFIVDYFSTDAYVTFEENVRGMNTLFINLNI